MNQEDVIEMAIEVYGSVHADDIKFAKLVVAKEREKLFDMLHEMHVKTNGQHNYYLHAVVHIRAKLKARGEA